MSPVFYNYFKQQWLLNRIDESYINAMVSSGRLTNVEADEILAMPRSE